MSSRQTKKSRTKAKTRKKDLDDFKSLTLGSKQPITIGNFTGSTPTETLSNAKTLLDDLNDLPNNQLVKQPSEVSVGRSVVQVKTLKNNIKNFIKRMTSSVLNKSRKNLTLDQEQDEEIIRTLRAVEKNKQTIAQNQLALENNRLDNPETLERLNNSQKLKVEASGGRVDTLPFEVKEIQEDFGKIIPERDAGSIALAKAKSKYLNKLAREAKKKLGPKKPRSEKQKAHMRKLHGLRLGRINSEQTGRGSDVILEKRLTHTLGKIPEVRGNHVGVSVNDIRREEQEERDTPPQYILNALSRIF